MAVYYVSHLGLEQVLHSFNHFCVLFKCCQEDIKIHTHQVELMQHLVHQCYWVGSTQK